MFTFCQNTGMCSYKDRSQLIPVTGIHRGTMVAVGEGRAQDIGKQSTSRPNKFIDPGFTTAQLVNGDVLKIQCCHSPAVKANYLLYTSAWPDIQAVPHERSRIPTYILGAYRMAHVR